MNAITESGPITPASAAFHVVGAKRQILTTRAMISARSAVAAVVGGLLLGYGARLAYGCNIGAYFSGIASGSLHGWAWIVAAFAGNVLGTKLRPMFDLEVEHTV